MSTNRSNRQENQNPQYTPKTFLSNEGSGKSLPSWFSLLRQCNIDDYYCHSDLSDLTGKNKRTILKMMDEMKVPYIVKKLGQQRIFYFSGKALNTLGVVYDSGYVWRA